MIAGGTSLGADVTVTISCAFTVLTPVISNVLGGTVLVTAETTYPIKEGVVGTVPGGGGAVQMPPDAEFIATPVSGWGPLDVTITDESTGAPSSRAGTSTSRPGAPGRAPPRPTAP